MLAKPLFLDGFAVQLVPQFVHGGEEGAKCGNCREYLAGDCEFGRIIKEETTALIYGSGFPFYLISSYSRVPRPIFSACSRHDFHSLSGVEFLKWS